MFRWLTSRLKRDREPLSDRELAEAESLRRQTEEELRRAEARQAEERAPLDGYSRGNMLGGGGGGF